MSLLADHGLTGHNPFGEHTGIRDNFNVGQRSSTVRFTDYKAMCQTSRPAICCMLPFSQFQGDYSVLICPLEEPGHSL